MPQMNTALQEGLWVDLKLWSQGILLDKGYPWSEECGYFHLLQLPSASTLL